MFLSEEHLRIATYFQWSLTVEFLYTWGERKLKEAVYTPVLYS
jgi:hypothetical protein